MVGVGWLAGARYLLADVFMGFRFPLACPPLPNLLEPLGCFSKDRTLSSVSRPVAQHTSLSFLMDSTGLSGLPDTFQEYPLDQEPFPCPNSQIPLCVPGMLELTTACLPTPLIDCPAKGPGSLLSPAS